MPLQNRVTPYGEIVALSERGLVMGNRGVLHDENRRIVRNAQLRRWIVCRLEFRGRHREIMRPNAYTELFFLDEATAFSAGHRPCAECRNADYRRFRSCWEACFGAPATAAGIDARLHGERLFGGKKRTYRAEAAALPSGTFVVQDGRAWLVSGDRLLAWSAGGYRDRRPRPVRGELEVLTPAAGVAVLAAGYRVGVHPTAGLTTSSMNAS
jgi:hypothetical protein